jgi:T5SS/PEP-CTERM-associated repeat protein
MRSKRIAIVLWTVAACAAASDTNAATKFWKDSVASSNWNVSNNWSAVSAAGTDNGGVPGAGEPAFILHNDGVARIVTVDASTPTLGLVTINQLGLGTTTLAMNSNVNLTATSLFVGGHHGGPLTSGQGAVDQSAGTIATVAGNALVLAYGAGSTGTYTLSGAGQFIAGESEHIGFFGNGTFNHSGGTNTLNAGVLIVGSAASGVGTYNLSGSGQLISNSSQYVADHGTGFFNHTGGTNTINGTNNLVLGNNPGSVGTYTISGTSTLTVNNDVIVGNLGTGTLTIQDQSSVQVGKNLTVGDGDTVNLQGGALLTGSGVASLQVDGALNVTGPNAVVTAPGIGNPFFGGDGSLNIGVDGNGTLNVAAGGVVTANSSSIGMGLGSTGGATVTGSGSQWNNNILLVGLYGNGTLNVAAGGVVTSWESYVAYDPNSTSTATVSGIGSRWDCTSYLSVGHFGTGALNVENGGVVSSVGGIIGYAGGTGTATVTGSGSQWNISGDLGVGYDGNGTLNITAGGVVTNTGWGYVSQEAGTFGTVAVGAVTVTGSGSQWNNGSLVVGRFGTGTLNIADGGSVSVANFTAVDADGQINNSDGSFVSNTVINQPGGEILGRGSFSAVGGWSNSGFMAFRGGVSNVYGAVNNLAGGTIFSEFFGTTYFHGDVVHNGVQIAVGEGSTIEFLGTVSGAGNYFSGGTVAMNGEFRPGNGPGVVSFASELAFGAGASLEIELGGTAPGTYDKVSVGGDLALDGDLIVSILPGFTPTAGQSFNILDWNGTLSGTFSELDLPTFDGLAWNTSQLYTNGVISLAAAGLAGDYNADGVVDAVDYTVWRNNLGDPNESDLNNNGDGGQVTASDYTWWKQHYGDTSPGSGGLATVAAGFIPEPTSWLLALLAALPAMACTRHLHRRHFR